MRYVIDLNLTPSQQADAYNLLYWHSECHNPPKGTYTETDIMPVQSDLLLNVISRDRHIHPVTETQSHFAVN